MEGAGLFWFEYYARRVTESQLTLSQLKNSTAIVVFGQYSVLMIFKIEIDFVFGNIWSCKHFMPRWFDRVSVTNLATEMQFFVAMC